MKLTQSQIRMLQSVRSQGQYARDARDEERSTPRGRVFAALYKRGMVYPYPPLLPPKLSPAGEQALKDNHKEPKPRKALPKAGKKVQAWDEIRTKELKPAFKRAGITKCEAQFGGCYGDNYLGFAHQRKRRHCTTPELMRDVALLCARCHDKLEILPERDMALAIQAIIVTRRVPVVLAVSPTK